MSNNLYFCINAIHGTQRTWIGNNRRVVGCIRGEKEEEEEKEAPGKLMALVPKIFPKIGLWHYNAGPGKYLMCQSIGFYPDGWIPNLRLPKYEI